MLQMIRIGDRFDAGDLAVFEAQSKDNAQLVLDDNDETDAIVDECGQRGACPALECRGNCVGAMKLAGIAETGGGRVGRKDGIGVEKSKQRLEVAVARSGKEGT